MPATYELIQTYTVSSAVPTVTLSSIPATYTDLVIVGNHRVVNGGGVAICMRFNGDTASNYEFMGYYSGGASNTGNHAEPYTMMYVGIASNTDFNTSVASVLNYSNPATYRQLLTRTGNIYFNSAYTGVWKNAAAAINSITFVCDGGSNIQSGSKFSIYGILKA